MVKYDYGVKPGARVMFVKQKPTSCKLVTCGVGFYCKQSAFPTYSLILDNLYFEIAGMTFI